MVVVGDVIEVDQATDDVILKARLFAMAALRADRHAFPGAKVLYPKVFRYC